MIEDNINYLRCRLLAAFAVLVLGGCASTPPAPVEDRSVGSHYSHRPEASSSGLSNVPSGSYRVHKGDTLYSIAFRNGLDFRDLARANGIASPYTIYVGQVIRLGGQSVARNEAPANAALPSRSSSQLSSVAPPRNAARSPTAIAPPANPANPPIAPPNVTTAAQSSPTENAASPEFRWRWPSDGQLVATFVSGDQTRQGINIAGKSGDAVRATADGEVVYSGNGLIGYGELIIVKHSSTMLSAYGHNRRRLVQEGDRVKAGQQIAEMGSSSATRDMLHFEIRRNGKPIDPLGLLPKR